MSCCLAYPLHAPYASCLSQIARSCDVISSTPFCWRLWRDVETRGGRRQEEEEEEFFNHYKNDLKRHAHTLSGDAGADLKSRAGGARTD